MGVLDLVRGVIGKLKAGDLGHYAAGVIVGYLTQYDPLLSVLGFLTFVIYELDEDWHLRDGAYRDIKAFGLGLFSVAIYVIKAHLGL